MTPPAPDFRTRDPAIGHSAEIAPVPGQAATGLPSVVLADDHRLLADTLAVLLAPEFTILRCVSDGAALIAAACELHPDIALIDVNMPRMNGLEAGEALRRLLPDCRLVYLTATQDPAAAAEVFAFGASGFLLKSCTSAELIEALHVVYRGGTYLSEAIAGGDLANLPGARADPIRRLTPREREVLRLAAGAMAMKEIARQLGIAPRTVAFHKYRGMATLGLRRHSDLVRFALEHQMMPEHPNKN